MIELLPSVSLFLYYALFALFLQKKIPQWYLIILYFLIFRMVFDYNKCTISYIECKFRKVPKKAGYIYQFLQSINDLRNNHCIFTISILFTMMVSWKYFIVDGSRIRM